MRPGVKPKQEKVPFFYDDEDGTGNHFITGALAEAKLQPFVRQGILQSGRGDSFAAVEGNE